MSEWIACNDRLPKHNQMVAVLACNPSYQFGYLQPLAGYFEETFYDVTVNRFKLTGVGALAWRVAYWMPLAHEDRAWEPGKPDFQKLFDWQKNAL